MLSLKVYRKYGKEYGDKTNPNISYQFYLPNINSDLIEIQPKGKWAVFTAPCSVSCGSGERLFIMSHIEKHKEKTAHTIC